MPVPTAAEIVLTDDERDALEALVRRRTSAQALALRARIVLAAADGLVNGEIAEREAISRPTVTKWRNRFAADRLDGLADAPRPGRPRTITDNKVEEVLVKTLESKPKDATHWSTRSMAREVGVTQNAVLRIWHAYGLKPHLGDTFKLSTTRGLSTRSTTSSVCTSTRPNGRSCCAWMRRARSRRWIAPSRSCRCCPACPNAPPTITSATAPQASTRRWT